MVCLTGLMDFQRVREQDEEGVVAESAIIKRKVSAPAVRLVGTKGACDACKKAGVAAECAYGIGAACARCKSAKGGMGRGSPPKQWGARRRRQSSSR